MEIIEKLFHEIKDVNATIYDKRFLFWWAAFLLVAHHFQLCSDCRRVIQLYQIFGGRFQVRDVVLYVLSQ